MSSTLREKKEISRQYWAGIFFVVGIILVGLVVFSLGKDKGFVQPKFQVTVLFNSVDGLIEGAPVLLAGVQVGTVDSIDFLDNDVEGRRVSVRLNIFEEYRKQLELNLSFGINTEGVLGQKFIDIRIKPGSRQADLKEPILGENTIDVRDLTILFTQAAESFTKMSTEFSKIDGQALSSSLKETADSLIQTSKGLNEIFEELSIISVKSKRILDRLEQKLIEGNLFKVF